jgi:Glu-tRNA(Gln) amidotransferase subunit E-like FAD-binding protein
MKHNKAFKQLNDLSPGTDIGYIIGKAKRGKAAELRSAKELHGLLRDYSYHLIGLGNTFRDIARLKGEFHGSNWRYYQGVTGEELKAIANKLNAMDPYDSSAIVALENEIEALAETLKVKGK